jgi:hypothetical protein
MYDRITRVDPARNIKVRPTSDERQGDPTAYAMTKDRVPAQAIVAIIEPRAITVSRLIRSSFFTLSRSVRYF